MKRGEKTMAFFKINKNYVNFDEYGRELVFTVKNFIDENTILVLNQDTKDIMDYNIKELEKSIEIKPYPEVEFKFLFALRFFLKDELQQEYDLNEMDELFVDLSDVGLYQSTHYVDNKEYEFRYYCNLKEMTCILQIEGLIYDIHSFSSIECLSEYIENLSIERIFDLFDEDKLQDLIQNKILEEI